MKKSLYLLSGLALLAASPVVAGINPANWTGLYGGVAVNWTAWNHKNRDTVTGKTESHGLKVRGMGYGLELGGGATVLPYLYLGANLSFDLSTASKKKTGDGAPLYAGDRTVKVKEKYNYAGTVQIGVPLCNFMPYAEVGYGKEVMETKISDAATGKNIFTIKPKPKGMIFGVGLKYQPTKNVLLGIAYRHGTGKSSVNNPLIPNNKLSYKTRSDSIRVSASYLFNM